METGKAECDQFPYALPEACFGQDVVDGDGRVGPTFVGLVDPLHTIPLHSTPFRPTPLHSNPLHSTPLHSTPFHPTPLLHSTPLHSNLLHSTPFHALELPLEFLLYKPGHTCQLHAAIFIYIAAASIVAANIDGPTKLADEQWRHSCDRTSIGAGLE